MIPILSMWKNRGGGGPINDGGRSDGTLRYVQLNKNVTVTEKGSFHAKCTFEL